MYTTILLVHDMLRWLLLFVLLIALARYISGWLVGKSWTKSDNILSIVLTSVFDLQLLIGLLLYFFLSPVTKIAFSDFGAAMKEPELRFYAVEHFALMLIALVLVHIGRTKSKKAKSSSSKFKITSIFYLIAMVVIMAAIPWGRIQ